MAGSGGAAIDSELLSKMITVKGLQSRLLCCANLIVLSAVFSCCGLVPSKSMLCRCISLKKNIFKSCKRSARSISNICICMKSTFAYLHFVYTKALIVYYPQLMLHLVCITCACNSSRIVIVLVLPKFSQSVVAVQCPNFVHWQQHWYFQNLSYNQQQQYSARTLYKCMGMQHLMRCMHLCVDHACT